MNLQLHCKHPGCLHPVKEGGLYTIDTPQQWLRVMPPINRLFGILKYIGPWINLSASIYSKLVKNDIALTKAMVSKLPELGFDEDDRSFLDSGDRAHQTRKISSAALRTLHECLKHKRSKSNLGQPYPHRHP